MRDGIDRRAFTAELKFMSHDERHLRMREFGEWMHEASNTAGSRPVIGLVASVIALALMILSFVLRRWISFFLPISIVTLALASWLNMDSARRARAWRRTHPFEEWRTGR